MNKHKQKIIKRNIRHNRVRAKVVGSSQAPRLCVFRSAGNIYAQIIDDTLGKTLVAGSSLKLKIAGKKSEIAKIVGKTLAEQALQKKINTVVFDRGGYKYHGRVKALADGAREGGLVF